MFSLWLCAAAVTLATAARPLDDRQHHGNLGCETQSAVCRIQNGTVVGTITLQSQGPGSPVTVNGQISGLTSGKHGFHVHQFGDLSNGCAAAGGHYNPFNRQHGAPSDTIRHVGDLGNIDANSNGVAQITSLTVNSVCVVLCLLLVVLLWCTSSRMTWEETVIKEASPQGMLVVGLAAA
uniref:Clone 592 transcribed RNA sequence n=1 Tax=Plectreurys tristis TaxID=33319 RepID=A0A0C4W9P9_PLETR|nr:Cu/Zn superoxide dismutase-like protein [Plectreurys tristis]